MKRVGIVKLCSSACIFAVASALVLGTSFAASAQERSGGLLRSLFSGGGDQSRATPASNWQDPSQPVFDTGGAEWSDRFDPSSEALRFRLESRDPTLAPATVAAIERAIDDYVRVSMSGGWGHVPGGQILRIGMAHPNVAALRHRLIASGDLSSQAGVSNNFDTYVEAAVVRFQARHGLVTDGVVHGETLAALNVPVETRIEQLRTNLVRVNSMAGDLGDRYVLVNIPAAEVEAVEGDFVASRHTAVVGKVDRPSPILSNSIRSVSFNPFWTVPTSIIRRDIIPTMQEDPEYLSRYRIRMFRGNEEVDPSNINWFSEEAASYTLRQDPSDQNSLGFIRINFPNQHSVYLHDTPERSLFGTNSRFHSSGCVRVQNVRQLVEWLLQPNSSEWSRDRIDAAIRSGETRDEVLRTPTPIYFSYITAWATSEGIVQFREDIYGRDGFGTAMTTEM